MSSVLGRPDPAGDETLSARVLDELREVGGDDLAAGLVELRREARPVLDEARRLAGASS